MAPPLLNDVKAYASITIHVWNILLWYKSNNTIAVGNKYLFNLMVDDNIQGDVDTNTNTCLDLQSQAVQVSPATPNARPNYKRSKNFSDHEDEVLVSTWLNISLDPIVGKDQKVGRYWSRIYPP